MKKRGNRSSAGLQVSASELAQMGRCEKLVLFEHLHGNRRTVLQQQARERGLVEHAMFYREGLMAVMGQTGLAVASYGYVMVKLPTRRVLPTAHRVELMSDEQVVALVRRREEIFAGRVLPRRSSVLKRCDACAFRADCH